jgi:hypothetical protein
MELVDLEVLQELPAIKAQLVTQAIQAIMV